MTRMSGGIDRYKVLVVGKNGKLNETIEGSALWSTVFERDFRMLSVLPVSIVLGVM